MLNRSLLVVRAKQPFLDWLRSVSPTIDVETTLAAINADASAYLVPEYEDDEDRDDILRQGFEVIFADQLEGWWTLEEDWPQDRTLDLFHAWFEVQWHAVVEDLVDGPLLDE